MRVRRYAGHVLVFGSVLLQYSYALSTSAIPYDILASPTYDVLFEKNHTVTKSEALGLMHEARAQDGAGSEWHAGGKYELFRVTPIESYVCQIPNVPKIVNDTKQVLGPEEREATLVEALQTLQELEGKCLATQRGYFMYQFCYGNIVRQLPTTQFMELLQISTVQSRESMDNPTNDNYILGLWHLNLQDTGGENERGSELVPAPGVQNANIADSKTLFLGQKLYLSQVWRDGSTCDLNGLPRTVEVQYFCSPDGSHTIASISEVLTCNYVLIVHVPSLCNVAAFRDIQTEDVHIIKCRLIVPDDPVERDTYLANAHASKKSHYHPAEIDPEFEFATPDQEQEQMELRADSTMDKDILEQQLSDTANDQLLPLELDAERLRDILKLMVEESRSGPHTESSVTLSMTAASDVPDAKGTPAPSYHDDL